MQLKDLLRHARREIADAARERMDNGELPLIEVQTVTVEVNVVVTETGEGGGGIDLQVITVSGKKTFENQQVQKITVVLKPIQLSRQERSMTSLAAPADGPQVRSAAPALAPLAAAPKLKK